MYVHNAKAKVLPVQVIHATGAAHLLHRITRLRMTLPELYWIKPLKCVHSDHQP
jgi:hypothetical protein